MPEDDIDEDYDMLEVDAADEAELDALDNADGGAAQ